MNSIKPYFLIVISILGIVNCSFSYPIIKDKQMNVLFIMVDDLRTELNCYGVTHIKSPNIDKLSKQGVMFTRAYAQQAVCSASRASLLTGCRPDVTGVDYPYSEYFMDEFRPNHLTIAEYFEKQGYNVQTYGKIHHGPADNLKTTHFDAAYMKFYALPENKKLGGTKGRSKNTPPYECADVPDEAYKDGFVTEVAIKKIEEYATQDKPFFIAMGFKKPHLPFCAPKKYWDLYDEDQIPLAINQELPKGSPAYAIASYELPSFAGGYAKNSQFVPIDQQKKLKHGYSACVSYVDALIGKLIDQLEKSGVKENTIIVLLSDHGWHLGEQGMWGKHANFENTTRVPLIVSVPSMEQGLRLEQFVEYVDIYPTLVELAGFEPIDYLEGTSFVPIMVNSELKWKSAAFSQYPRGKMEGYAIRTNDFRYIEWRLSDHTVVATELFDHTTDPLETINVASDSKYKNIVADLSVQLNKGWKAALPDGIQNLSNNPLAPPAVALGTHSK